MKYLRNQNDSYTGSDLLNEFFGWPLYENKRNLQMRTDIEEKEDEFKLDIDLPGFKKENIEIHVEDGYLTVSASTNNKKEENDKKGNFLCKERYYGSLSRTFYLGDVNEDEIKAKYDGGVLSINVPKAKEVLPQRKLINIE